MCLDVNDCYGIKEFQVMVDYISFLCVIGAAYGTSDKNPLKFVIGFGILVGIISLLATNSTEVSYNTDTVMTKILICVAITYLSFAASYYYSTKI